MPLSFLELLIEKKKCVFLSQAVGPHLYQMLTKTFIYIGEYLIFDQVSVEKGYFRINDIQFEACYFLLNILKMF